ncbi:MAG: hypothetical protein FWG67_02425 [Defluviitaleaceae bacterium]|nr:hypothetical protein [Defluviitaleaceae bacterium]
MQKQAFKDVEIIQKRRENLKAQYSTLETGIYIEGQIQAFERWKVLDSLVVVIPEGFKVMSEAFAKIKYPLVFKTSCILTHHNLETNLTFNEFPNAPGTTLMQGIQLVKETLENEQGTFDFSEVKPFKNVRGYYFECRQQVMDGALYHMLAHLKQDDRIYQLTFNCLFSNHMDWKSAVVQMWESVEYRKET